MATNKLMNKDQGDTIIAKLDTIANKIQGINRDTIITSEQVTNMTGYQQDSPTTANSILTTDTLNDAIRKLETGVETNESNILSLQGVYKNKQTHTGSANFTNTSGTDKIKLTFVMSSTQYEQLKIAVADDNQLTNADYYTISPTDTLYVPSRYPSTYVRVLQVDGSSTTGVELTAEFFIATDKTLNARNNWTSGSRSVQLFNGKVVNNSIGNDSVFVGYGSGGSSTGVKNTTVGVENLNDTTGQRNTSIGYHSLFRNTSADDNTAIGAESADDTTSGKQNTALGAYALQRNALGNNNTAVGYRALRGDTTSGVFDPTAEFQNNTVVGAQSMVNKKSGNNNVVLGFNSCNSATAVNGCIVIGNSVEPTSNNQMIIGNTSISEVILCGNKKINFNTDGTITWETVT